MNAPMKTITVEISDLAYQQLKDAAEREGTTIEALVRLPLEKAAYAAKEGGLL